MKITLIFIFLIGFIMEEVKFEPMFKSISPSILSIDGRAMKALKIACDEFEISGKDLREFNIITSEETDAGKRDNYGADVFVVTFMGKLSPGKRGLGTANRVPGSVTYIISKDKWKIVKEQGIR